VPDKLKILHLEDNPHDAALVKRELERNMEHFELLWVKNKTEYEDALEHYSPAVIISDHTLGGFDSIEALSILHAKETNIPFILVTGTVSEDFAVKIIKSGADDYILKDRLQRLPDAITTALNIHKTERIRVLTEAALKESENKFRILFDSASDGIVIADNKGRQVDVNLKACAITGYSREEMLLMNITDNFYEDELQTFPIKWKELYAGKTILSERKIRRKDGSPLDIEISAKMLPDGNFNAIVRDVTERKRLEEAISKSEERYKALFESNLAGIYQTTLNGKVLVCNEAFCRMLGYDNTEELMELNANEFYFNSIERDQFLFKLLRKKSLFNFESVLKRKNGMPIFSMENISLQHDTVTGEQVIQGIMINITEEKLAEQALRKKQDSLIEAQRMARVGSWEWQPDTDTSNWSEEVFNIFGIEYKLPPPSSKELRNMYGYGAWKDISENVSKTLHTGDPYTVESAILTPAGKKAWIITRGEAVRDDAGAIMMLRGTVQDISERKNAEEQLQESEERYRQIVETAQEGIWLFDKDYKTIFANKKLGEIFEYDPAEMIGKSSFDFMLFEDRPAGIKAMEKAILDGHHIHEMRFITGSNKIIWACLSVSSLADHEHQDAGGLAMVTDITERKQSDQKLKEYNDQLRELATHLQNIREEERIQIARDIHDELGQQLTGLKMDMYALNKKIERGNEHTSEDIKVIIDLIDETVNSVRKISANLRPSILDDLGLIPALIWHSEEVEKRFNIKVEFTSPLTDIGLPVETATGLFRIYQETLTNAVRHANAHTITGSLVQEGNRLILEVKDDGKGMDMATNKKSFGLLGIKERVVVLNGKYSMKSEPGKGTSLMVSVPL
jgi:PAS domain S-box-containing protein